jgi:CBS domain-containing protein
MPTRKVSKVLGNRDFLAVTPATPVSDVAVMMRAAGQGAAVVVDRAGRLLGICTERDLVFRVVAEGRDPGATPVRTVMSPEPQTVRADMLFGHALHLMHEAGGPAHARRGRFRPSPRHRLFKGCAESRDRSPWQGAGAKGVHCGNPLILESGNGVHRAIEAH